MLDWLDRHVQVSGGQWVIGVRDRIPRSLLGWRRLDLATQYLIAGSVSIILIMLTAGAVLNAFLAQNEIRERGFQTALFLEGVFSPLLQDVSRRTSR